MKTGWWLANCKHSDVLDGSWTHHLQDWTLYAHHFQTIKAWFKTLFLVQWSSSKSILNHALLHSLCCLLNLTWSSYHILSVGSLEVCFDNLASVPRTEHNIPSLLILRIKTPVHSSTHHMRTQHDDHSFHPCLCSFLQKAVSNPWSDNHWSEPWIWILLCHYFHDWNSFQNSLFKKTMCKMLL